MTPHYVSHFQKRPPEINQAGCKAFSQAKLKVISKRNRKVWIIDIVGTWKIYYILTYCTNVENYAIHT